LSHGHWDDTGGVPKAMELFTYARATFTGTMP
jgi:metal-dependent hydrolase (beta-lactamase superfamily II)